MPQLTCIPIALHLINLFYLVEWNNCHQPCGPDRFNCQCRYYRDNRYYIDWYASERECIDLSWLCDGYSDCSGGEDEVHCVCSDDEFQCNDCERGNECDDGIPLHQCIHKKWVDDDQRDCKNENDESRYLKIFNVLFSLFTNITVNSKNLHICFCNVMLTSLHIKSYSNKNSTTFDIVSELIQVCL